MRDYFALSQARMRSEISLMHEETIGILRRKNIKYSSLRSALVPSIERDEAVLIFDSTQIDSAMYGREVLFRLLPLLDSRTTQSILCGDLICDDQQFILDILRKEMMLCRSFTFVHSTLLYGVYLNNLTNEGLSRLDVHLRSFPAYLGYVPTTFRSRAKAFMSFSMTNLCVKSEKTVILGHENDRSNDENINITPYPFEEVGYRVASLQELNFGIFLSFKVERPVFGAFEVDTDMALNAISDSVLPLDGFSVELDEAKHGYLINEKLGKLKVAGLHDADRHRIAAIIQSQIKASYIYNLCFLKEHNVAKFNVKLEVERVDGYPTRLLASVEYIPIKKVLRVITLH